MEPADLFLSPDLTEAQAQAYLRSLGFRDVAAVDASLQQIADDLVAREALGRLAPDLIPALLESPDPDASAGNLAQYVLARTGRAMLLDYLREDPRALHVLTYVLGASPRLSEILIRTPEYFHWLVSQVERSAPDRQDHEEELVSAFGAIDDSSEGLNLLRRWKRRETLRVGTRDLLRRETVHTATAQLSDIAAVAIDFALAIVLHRRLEAERLEKPPGAFAVVATGRLGARELGYESGVELFYVFEDELEGARSPAAEFFLRVGADLTVALAEETHEGVLYRVGQPPWPHHGGRPRACRIQEYAGYFGRPADFAERLVLTRARPVAGDAELGARFVEVCSQFAYGEPGDASALRPVMDNWSGGRVEALTHALQMAHGRRHDPLRGAGTLAVLDTVAREGLAPAEICRELDHAYVFLRTAEHRRELGVPDDTGKQVEASQARVKDLCGRLADWQIEKFRD